MSDIEKALQQVIDHCAQEVERVCDWKVRTNSERGSHRSSYNEGREESALRVGYYVLGVGERNGLTLNTEKLFKAESRSLLP